MAVRMQKLAEGAEEPIAKLVRSLLMELVDAKLGVGGAKELAKELSGNGRWKWDINWKASPMPSVMEVAGEEAKKVEYSTI